MEFSIVVIMSPLSMRKSYTREWKIRMEPKTPQTSINIRQCLSDLQGRKRFFSVLSKVKGKLVCLKARSVRPFSRFRTENSFFVWKYSHSFSHCLVELERAQRRWLLCLFPALLMVFSWCLTVFPVCYRCCIYLNHLRASVQNKVHLRSSNANLTKLSNL